MKTALKKALSLIGLAAFVALPAAAQKVTEINFYYPVAVGGPVTKTIDQMAADFGKENPDIKVNPIYSGTYQESIVKALTATKSGKPPSSRCCSSTDMFTLIDEDAIVPIDNVAKGADDKKWLDGFYKSFMMNSQTERQDLGHPVPALDRSCCTGTRMRSRKPASIPKRARQLGPRWSSSRRSSRRTMPAAT